MSDQASTPQLSFQFNNPDYPNTIFISSDPTVNQLTFTISTNAQGTTFTPGVPVPKPQAPAANGSLLYLDLTNLRLTGAEFAALKFSAAGWQSAKYGDSGSQLVCMTPEEEVVLGAGQVIAFTVTGFATSAPPAQSTVQLTDTYYRVQGVTLGNLGLTTNFQVVLQNPPEGQEDLHPVIALQVPNVYLVNSIPEYQDVSNRLTLTLGRGITPRRVVAAATTSFRVSFVYADDQYGYGALATVTEARAFAVAAGLNAQGWTINPVLNAQSPFWELKPPENGDILGPAGTMTVEFVVSSIVTRFQPGPTVMLVSYSDVPGYADGSYPVTLHKVPHVSIRNMSVTPNPSHLTDGKVKVKVSWDAFDAGTLTLMPLYLDVTGKSSAEATIDATTVFTLQAQGLQLANSGNIAFRNAEAQVLPVINSFTASPSSIYYKDFPRDVALAWNVNTNERVKISSSTGVVDPNQYAPVGSLTKSIAKPQMLTLSPAKEPDNLRIRRSLILSAFAVRSKTFSASARFVAASPNAGFVATVDPSSNQLFIRDTFGFQPIGSPATVGAGPTGVAFSPGDQLIFTANSGDGSVSIVPVTATGQATPYQLGTPTSVTLGDSPQQVAASPDAKYLYVSVAKAGRSGVLAILQQQEGTYAHLLDLVVGTSPAGVAVSPSGAQIFVANTTDNSVSVIGLAGNGGFSVVKTISQLDQPKSLAVTPDGSLLLVVCSGNDTVVGINTQISDDSPRRVYEVGGGPQQIALSPNGAYAMVTNRTGNSVSLLSYDTDRQNSKILEKNLPVGTAPAGIAFSSEGGVAVVGSERGTVTALTLAQYRENAQLVTVGEVPTNVAVTPDLSRAYLWHDATISIQSGPAKPSTGFYAYELGSQTITPQMQGDPLISIAFHPDPVAKRGFVTATNAPDVRVIDTTTYQLVDTISIPPANSQREPRQLAISGNGSRLFTLVSDGGGHYSMVVLGVDPARRTFPVLADLPLFTISGSSFLFVCAGPDGSRAYALNSVDHQLWVVRADGRGRYNVDPNPVQVGKGGSAMAISPDGSALYLLNKAGMVNNISAVATDTLQVATTYLPEPATAVSLNRLTLSPDGASLLATDHASTGVQVLNARTLGFVQTLSWTDDVEYPYGLAVFPDGSRILETNALSSNVGIVTQIQPA